LYEQAARDVHNLSEALERLTAGELGAAARAASRVGANNLGRWVSRDVQATSERRRLSSRGSWPAKSHLTAGPNLWRELATLRGEPGSRPLGPWLEVSLRRHRRRMQAELETRTTRLAAALSR
jgi:hypothetical protein